MATVLEKIKDGAKNAIDAMSDKLQTIFTGNDGVDPNAEFINTPDQQMLYDNVMRDYTVFKSARQMIEPLWREEQRIYMGDHWYGLRSPSVSRLRPNSVDNIAWAQCESIIGKLSGWDPWPEFSEQEPSDEQKAKDLNAYMPYELNKIKFKQKYVKAIRQCVVHGPLIFKTIYDPTVEGGRGMHRYIGQNDIIPVELGSFFPDPRITDFLYLQDMGAIIINTRRTLEYFQQKWPVQGKKVQPDNLAQDVQIYNYPNYGMAQHTFNYVDTTWYPWDASTQTQTAGLLEYWYRGLPKMMTEEDKQLFTEQAEMLLAQGKDPSEAYAKANGTMEGVHCVYVSTSGVFLEHKSYVYDHGKYPFTARTLFPNGRNVWGKGFMRDMIKPQIMLNKYTEIAIETAAKSGNSAIVYEEGAITKLGTWKEQRSQEGAMLPVAMGRMQDWKELHGVNPPDSIWKAIDYYLNILQKIPGQFDSANGQASPNVTSGEQAKALIAAASTRLNTVTELIAEALTEVFEHYIELIAQFYTDARIARVDGRQVAIGRDSIVSQAQTTFMKDGMPIPVVEEYVPEFDILVNITAEKPTDAQYWLQMAFNLLPMRDPVTNLPMIDAEAVRYVIDNGRMEPMDVIQQRIQKEAGLMQQMQMLQQQNQQLQMENAGMQQQYAQLASQHQQMQGEQEQYNRQMQERKMAMDEAKTASQILKDQSQVGGVV